MNSPRPNAQEGVIVIDGRVLRGNKAELRRARVLVALEDGPSTLGALADMTRIGGALLDSAVFHLLREEKIEMYRGRGGPLGLWYYRLKGANR